MNDPDKQVLFIIIAVLILGLIFVICLARQRQGTMIRRITAMDFYGF